jgi:hypothetical protein
MGLPQQYKRGHMVTPEIVRWFADYHQRHPNWGLFGPDGPGDPGQILITQPERVQQADRAMVRWWNGLDAAGREELERRVATLELLRRQDAPAPRQPTPRSADA